MKNYRTCSSDVCVYFIGNKKDLEDKKQVDSEEAKDLAQKYSIKYFETSAKSDEDLENVLNCMIKDVMNEIFFSK